MARKVKNLLGLALLSYLRQDPKHPYELARTLKDNGDDRAVKYSHSSVYQVVAQLAGAGFIAPEGTSREGALPERTVYQLTEAGQAELHDWLHELIAVPNFEYPHLAAGLSFMAALPPSELLQLLDTRHGALLALRQELAELIHTATIVNGVDPLFLADEDYRLAMVESEITYIGHLITRINQPETGYGRVWREFHQEKS
ncbi:DNA-binding PadR family transcriptional regulator [Allocatelliglobosispora scoriae]|uniref:DNA-binding PadR family transcriptional regulator n=1 Tax=Allocatelliglobosispora scoriae TaxID=643052 RepID=A0A841C3Z3_9ACTN|nr:PadR family transcriptional regulator [Allocatelliglobosispora scoriae]MBB5874605.1 DNA-binding PadR family transcriptional regulator [Allocatelliglobosispora scoriae]